MAKSNERDRHNNNIVNSIPSADRWPDGTKHTRATSLLPNIYGLSADKLVAHLPNCTVRPKSTATGETPNFTVFGNERGTEEMEEFSHQQKMTTIHNKVQNELEWTKAIQKKYYDREREEAPSLKEGDRVYLKRRSTGKTTFNLKTKRTSTKLDYLKLGSFVIKRKLDYDNYELNLPTRMKIHPVFHISLLTKTDIPETAENEPINDEEYEVERVIKKRVRPGKVEYLVKWLGYENCDNTWEPVTNLYCPKLIQKFERRQQRKAKKKANCQRKAKKKADYEQDELSQC